MCFLSARATSVRFLCLFIFQKRKKKREKKWDDKTERGAAACWRLHPGSVGSVYSLIFQSFKRRSRSPHSTKKNHIIKTGCIYSEACAACHPESAQEAKPQVEEVMAA